MLPRQLFAKLHPGGDQRLYLFDGAVQVGADIWRQLPRQRHGRIFRQKQQFRTRFFRLAHDGRKVRRIGFPCLDQFDGILAGGEAGHRFPSPAAIFFIQKDSGFGLSALSSISCQVKLVRSSGWWR
ncbi:hypothetical protein D3C80_741970 [compost metagenome]